MPPVIAAVVAIASIAVAGTTIGAIVATAAIGSIVSFGISAIASTLVKDKRRTARSGGFTVSQNLADRTLIVRSSIESHKVIYGQVRVSGPLVFVATSTVSGSRPQRNGYLHMIIALAAHEIEAIDTVYIDETAVTISGNNVTAPSRFLDSSGSPLIYVRKYLGTDSQQADSVLVSANVGWTQNHRLKGIAYLYVRFRYDRNAFPNGIPQISAIVRGKKVYDPRTALTAYSNNWALCVRDYITNAEYGLGASDDEINDATFIAAANTSDENVALKGGGTQKRYTCNGVIDTAEKPIEVLKDLASAGAGVIPYTQGQFKCFAGSYTSPSVTLDESWLSGDVEVMAKTPRSELFNAVKGVYVEPGKKWQPTDFPAVTNSFYETQDGGQRIYRDIELPFTTHTEAAQRIGKILLEKSRQGIVATVPCNYKALQVGIWDTVFVSLSLLGWASKIFRVTQWEFNREGGVTLTLQEESAVSYDWNSGQATTYDPAPDTNLPDASFVDPPGVPSVAEQLYESQTGSGLKNRAILTWAESEDAFVSRYAAEYKLSSDTSWLQLGEFIEPTATVNDIAPGVYDFRVKAISWKGVSSDYATVTWEIYGLSVPPADITGFTLNAINNNAHLQWVQPSELDVRIGGHVLLKWTSKTSGATWSDAIDIAPALPGVATNAVVPLLAGTYLVKAIDSTGNESVNATTIVTDVANILAMNAVATVAQAPSFAGAKTNLLVSSGKLLLDSPDLFDSAPGNFDDKFGLFDSNSFYTTGEYIFDDSGDDYTDLGAVYVSRVSISVESLVYDALATSDDAAGDFDAREGLFDGEDRANINLEFYLRTTNDDPAGAPTWSAWRKFIAGDYSARAFQFKVIVTSQKYSNNIEISAMTAEIDVPDRIETEEDYSISSGGHTFSFSKPFFVTPNIGVSIQGGNTGDYYRITSKTNTGFKLELFDSSGTSKAGVVDWIARGY